MGCCSLEEAEPNTVHPPRVTSWDLDTSMAQCLSLTAPPATPQCWGEIPPSVRLGHHQGAPLPI